MARQLQKEEGKSEMLDEMHHRGGGARGDQVVLQTLACACDFLAADDAQCRDMDIFRPNREPRAGVLRRQRDGRQHVLA